MKASERPDALLLDFGGALFESVRNTNWLDDLTEAVHACLRRTHTTVPDRDTIRRDLEVARRVEKAWKVAASRTARPIEITRELYWGEFVAADWSPSHRAALLADSVELSRTLMLTMSQYEPRPGTREVLTEARRLGMPVAVVSNTTCGDVFRGIIRREGFDELIAVSVFSDEVGIRKPNPAMLQIAAAGLGVDIERCWYGGDHYDRDIMCGRRAGVGLAVLIHDKKTFNPPYAAQVQPDVEVDSMNELAHLLARTQAPIAMSEAAARRVSQGSTVQAKAHDSEEAISTQDRLRAYKGAVPSWRPRALLLDHGGVIATSKKRPEARAEVAQRIVTYLAHTGWHEFDAERIAEDIKLGKERDSERKDCRDGRSVCEVTRLEFWRDLVAGDWPEHPRAAITAHAAVLSFDWHSTKSERTLRPGALELLAYCAEHDLPVGVVSNTQCGAVVRAFGRRVGTAPYFGVEVYSDELGFRKPDPITIETAAQALAVDPRDCWYVGDKPHRDLACARRAHVGHSVLMLRPEEAEQVPDADLVVHDATELLGHLAAVLA